MLKVLVGSVVALSLLIGCSQSAPPAQNELARVEARPNNFPSYPREHTTYLSYSDAHGFQVTYLGRNGRSALWYPGNLAAVPEEWKQITTASGVRAICWRHPSNSYNPVLKQQGGDWGCQRLDLSQKLTVASLPGDPFKLMSGSIPYRRGKCDAPEAFNFDRSTYGC